ncbi:30029_t:CDS:1, partial [Racocetra persica]
KTDYEKNAKCETKNINLKAELKKNKKDINNFLAKNSELKIQVAKLSRDFEKIKSKEITNDYLEKLQIFLLTKNKI